MVSAIQLADDKAVVTSNHKGLQHQRDNFSRITKKHAVKIKC